MAKFTRIAVKGAAKALAKFDNAHWEDMGEDDRNDYMREAEKILEGAKKELLGTKD